MRATPSSRRRSSRPTMRTRPRAAVASSAPRTAGEVPKLLKETEVYVKYGLHAKALEHRKRIISAGPHNIDAHEKVKTVALAMGNMAEAKASLETMLRLCTQ